MNGLCSKVREHYHNFCSAFVNCKPCITLVVLIPASAPPLVYQRPWYMLPCLWDDAYKIINGGGTRTPSLPPFLCACIINEKGVDLALCYLCVMVQWVIGSIPRG